MKRSGSNGAMMSSKAHIPKGWRLVRLGDVASTRNDLSNPMRDESLPYVALEHVSSGGAINGLGLASDSVSIKTKFRDGDTLYGKLRPNLRKVVRAEFDGVCSTEILAIFAKGQEDGKFLSHLIRSDILHRHAMRGITGTKMPRTSWGHLKTFEFVSPPLAEQRAIAAVLDAIDDAIERTEAVIAATEQLRDSLLRQLLTRGVPGWHTEWKEAPGLGTIPAGWEVMRLGEVAEVRNGTTPSRKEKCYWENGSIPFVKTGRVNDIFISEPDEFITAEAVTNSGAVVVPEGSVLIAMIGQGKTRGMTARLGFCAAINQNFAAIYEPKVGFGLDYFFAWASHNYPLIRALSQGSNQNALNCELIQRMLIPLPPIDEQQAIAGLLDGVDVTIGQAKHGTNMLKLLKDSTADALLTGRVRVGV